MKSHKRHSALWRNTSLALTTDMKNDASPLCLPVIYSSPCKSIQASSINLSSTNKTKEASPKLSKVGSISDVEFIIGKTKDIFTNLKSNKQTNDQIKLDDEKNQLMIRNQRVQIRGNYVDDLMDRIRLQDIIKKLQTKVVHRTISRIYDPNDVDVLLKTTQYTKKNLVNSTEPELFDQDVRVMGIQKYTDQIKMQLHQDEQKYTSKKEKQNEQLQKTLSKTAKLSQVKEELLYSLKKADPIKAIKLIESYPDVTHEHYAVWHSTV